MRSFMLPVGFCPSSFTKMAAELGGTTLRSRTIDVFPIASRTSIDVQTPLPAEAFAAAGFYVALRPHPSGDVFAGELPALHASTKEEKRSMTTGIGVDKA